MAADGGDLIAKYALANRYWTGDIVDKDEKGAMRLFKEAANGGFIMARNALAAIHANLGTPGDIEVAMAHWGVAARCGSKSALEQVRNAFLVNTEDGLFTKEEYGEILRSFQRAREGLDTPSRKKALKWLPYVDEVDDTI